MDATAAAASALAAIRANGRTLPALRRTRAFDDVTGTATDETTATGEVPGVVLPRYKGMIFASLDETYSSDMVKRQARTVLAAAAGCTLGKPAPLDEISFDGATWLVIGLSELSPTGTPIIYTMGVVQK